MLLIQKKNKVKRKILVNGKAKSLRSNHTATDKLNVIFLSPKQQKSNHFDSCHILDSNKENI